MATSYATVEQYREETGDDATDAERVETMLSELSAELRLECGIGEGRALTEDQSLVCRRLVIDAARKALVPPSLGGMGEVFGASQASWTANGFSGQYTVANPTGSAWFDRQALTRLRRSLGLVSRVGTIMPAIGGA